MNKLLLILAVLFTINVNAQLDTEHWFGPMMDRSNQSWPYQSIYMSTDQTTPFKVEIYNNNAVIGSVMLSKGNPQKYPLSRATIISTSDSDLFKPITKGIYLKGEKPFFANLRFSVNQHAEIVTSKGTAGKGTEFYATPAPIAANLTNVTFVTSVLATENGTDVTINGFNPSVQFSDNVPRTQFTFTLQKGQSYIIDGRSSNSQNWTGFIGAKITSTKPVVVTNGNFNGQYVPTTASSTDILMDQSVPTDKLGQEFALVKGNGIIYQPGNSNYSQNMEKAFVVATVNNTNIYVNNETTPVNPTPLNAGQFFIVPSEKYINQGNGQYNMYLKTTENAYVFQLLAGTDGSNGTNQIATGGYNYIPPLSCYLPKKIDELGFISENEGYKDGNYDLDSPTKLNIITEKGATIQVLRNGVNFPLTNIDGPYNLTGTNNWVTYSINRGSTTTGPNSVSGNMTVISSKAVTAGISAGDGAVGYGGYFAGFSKIPLPVKSGPACLKDGNVFLEITAGFDSYQWYERDLAGNATPISGATSNIYQVTHAGIYFAELQQGSCAPVSTQDYKFYNCDSYTNYDYNSCGNEVIIPNFTLSTQVVDPATVQITAQPTKGTAVVNNTTGEITYTAFANASGTDYFKYIFKGIGAIPDVEEVQITVQMIDWKSNAKLEECSTNGTATYNLSLADVSSDTSLIKSYFKTEYGAQNNIPADEITNFTAYTTTDTTIYVRLKNNINCIAVAPVVLKSKLAPEVHENLYTKLHCDEDIDGKIDGIYKVDLSTITPIVMPVASNFVVSYYSDAGLANQITGVFSFTADNTPIWIKVVSPNGCPTITKQILLKTGTKFTINTPQNATVCDNDLNNTESVNLDHYKNLFTTDTSATVKYFDDLTKAQNNTPTTVATQNITADKTFYYRFSRAGFCDEIGILNIALKKPTPSTTLPATVTVCQGNTAILDVGTGYASPGTILWSTGATTQTISAGVGTYWVDLTNASGCTYRQNVTVIEAPKAILDPSLYDATRCDTNFDGISDPVNFNTVTPIIVTNYTTNPGLFTVKYYLNLADANAGNNNTIPNLTNWTFTTNTTVYVRVESPNCSSITGQINFQFGTSFPLIATTENVKICDNDLNNTENINLANYRNLFTTDTSATVRYFDDFTNAQNNTGNINAAQTITADKIFYYRFKKVGFCDVIGTLNVTFKQATPTSLQDSYTVCQGSSITLNAEGPSVYSAWLWKKGTTVVSTTSQAILSAGTYTINFTNLSGCVFTKTISVVESPKPNWNISAYNATHCDDDFDGQININLGTVTPTILPNHSSFTVEYFANAALTQSLPNNWSYSANTTIYVRATSPYCPAEIQTIDFKIGNSVQLSTPSATVKECDDDFDGIKSVNLSNYIKNFNTNSGVTATYFATLPDAQNNLNAISINVTVNTSGTYYLRLHLNTFCDEIGKLTVNIQIPKTSTVLKDEKICPEATIKLDAGSGFDAYLWSTGATSQTITVPVGEYSVKLTFDGCSTTQNVSVTAVELPKITSVEIKGSTVTVYASGGKAPLEYAIDGGSYQTSNVFTNVRGGEHTISVISADQCKPVTTTIDVIELYNAISPNNDGINDVLNYSALLKKEEPFIQIFDRYGQLVFTGDSNNRYSWDGKSFGKVVATGTYWYVMKWKEPGATAFTEYQGWVLVKSRD